MNTRTLLISSVLVLACGGRTTGPSGLLPDGGSSLLPDGGTASSDAQAGDASTATIPPHECNDVAFAGPAVPHQFVHAPVPALKATGIPARGTYFLVSYTTYQTGTGPTTSNGTARETFVIEADGVTWSYANQDTDGTWYGASAILAQTPGGVTRKLSCPYEGAPMPIQFVDVGGKVGLVTGSDVWVFQKLP